MLSINKILNKVNLIKNKNFININYSYDGIIIFALLISVIFTHLFYFSFTKYYIQFTEIFFIFGLFYIIKKKIHLPKNTLNGIDISYLFLILILFLNIISHPNKIVGLQVLASLYLISLYFLFSLLLKSKSFESNYRILKNASKFGLIFLIIIGYIGLLLFYSIGFKKFVLVYENYPYFGDVIRTKGLNFSPNIYISILTFFVCLSKFFKQLNLKYIVLIGLIAILSLTKEALLLIVLIVIFSIDDEKLSIFQKKIFFLSGGVLYVIFSWFIFSTTFFKSGLINKTLITPDPLFANKFISIYGTTYFKLFTNGIFILNNNLLSGVGLGLFTPELTKLVSIGKYPELFDKCEPADSYFGIASQLGVLFFLFITMMIVSLKRIFHNKINSSTLPLFLLTLYFFIESVCVGSFHFRHYYIFFAILPVLLSFHENTNFKNQN